MIVIRGSSKSAIHHDPRLRANAAASHAFPSMSAHYHGSGSRSNIYSEDRYTNWAEYDPSWAEVQAVYRKFDHRISKRPAFPKVIALPVMDGFMQCCPPSRITSKLENLAPEFIEGLRAVFILGGTQKQLNSWGSGVSCLGRYWRSCVFLHAYPSSGWRASNLSNMRAFFLRHVLVHEIGHHVDTRVGVTTKERERFANNFARQHG
jgi:hypothetical protein